MQNEQTKSKLGRLEVSFSEIFCIIGFAHYILYIIHPVIYSCYKAYVMYQLQSSYQDFIIYAHHDIAIIGYIVYMPYRL